VVAAFTAGKTACVTTFVAVWAPIFNCAILVFAAKNTTAKAINLITFFMVFSIGLIRIQFITLKKPFAKCMP